MDTDYHNPMRRRRIAKAQQRTTTFLVWFLAALVLIASFVVSDHVRIANPCSCSTDMECAIKCGGDGSPY